MFPLHFRIQASAMQPDRTAFPTATRPGARNTFPAASVAIA